MPIITISKSAALRANWHKELVASHLSAQFDNGNLTAFPPGLNQLTKEYLDRKRVRTNTDDCDRHLSELVREHVEREGGSLEVAVLACTLEFSPWFAVATLKSLRGDSQANPSYSRYLRLLIVAHSIAPTYVSQQEAQIAAALLQIRLAHADPLLIFRHMMSTLSEIQASQVLPAEYINKLLTFCQIPKSYELVFHMLQSRCQLASLHEAVAWVDPILLHPQQHPLAYEVLQAQIPQLPLWASWRPDESMLQQWESYSFTPEQLARLQPIFYLEGPDLTGAGHATFKEAGTACFQSVAVEPQELGLVQHLHRLLLEAMQTGPESINALCRLCIDATATPKSLSFAEKIIRIGDEVCSKAATTIVDSLTPTASTGTRLATLTHVLPVLQHHPTMREAFADRVIDIVVPTMEASQSQYKAYLQSSSGDTMGPAIIEYGRAIKRAPWLNDVVLPEGFLVTIDRFPTDYIHQRIASHLASPHTAQAETALKNYLVGTVGGTATSEDEIAALKQAVDAEQEFFLAHPDVERNRTLSAIKKLPYVADTAFLRACRQQILDEDLVLLQDMLGLIERNNCVACIDMLRILARRIELPMLVSHVWITLVELMLQHQRDTMLAWACDNLPVKSWFRFVADLRIVFGQQPDQAATLASFGMSMDLLAWWQQLHGEYYVAVDYLDRMQRQRSGGIGSMKWLYLQEIPNVEPLLGVIAGQRSLGYDHRWILSFFEPLPESIATLCNCIAAHGKSSPQGLYGIRTILERFYTAQMWPDSATQAYMMAWTRSNELTEDDKKTLALLSELMSIKPSMNAHGLGVIKNEMLKNYDSVIEMAREVEGLRIQLSRADKDRASALVQRLGMQGTRPYIDPGIPESLSDAIECVGPQEYELCFPLTHLHGHDRKARGIGSDLFPILTVRVMLGGADTTHGFCVHMVPHETVAEPGNGLHVQLKQQARHTYWRPHLQRIQKPASRICTASFNLFTHALAQRLHRHFRNGDVTLRSIYDIVSDTIKRPGSECTSCGEPLTGLWKPTICTSDWCGKEMARSGLLVRAYGLLVDAPVLDFLLGCVFAAAKDSAGLQLLSSDCPFDRTRLCTILNSFPALPAQEGQTPYDVLSQIRSSAYLSHEREQVLAWMSKWFRGCMLTAPQGMRLSIMSDAEQFLLFNSTPECEKAFDDCVQAGGPRSAVKTGDVVFHGSQSSRMWKVLTEGLRNMSNTQYMAHGAVNGPGIYMADEPVTSFGYSGHFNSTWAKSAFKGKKVLLGCELVEPNPNAPLPAGTKKPPAGTHIVTDESRVLVRYIFICQPSQSMPPSRHIDTAMRSTFAKLRAGPAA